MLKKLIPIRSCLLLYGESRSLLLAVTYYRTELAEWKSSEDSGASDFLDKVYNADARVIL